MNETEQRYHSNKQEFLALKWAVTEQFHEYLSPYGKNRNEFVVQTDNNPLTYIFSSANLDAAGQRWVAQLASYNFALEYQKGKDNTVANFLSRLDDHLPTGKVQDYLNKVPYPGVKAVLDNAIMPLTDRAKQGVRPNKNNQKASQEVTIGARPARLAMHDPGSRNCAIFVCYINSSELHLQSVALRSQYSDPAPEAVMLQ